VGVACFFLGWQCCKAPGFPCLPLTNVNSKIARRVCNIAINKNILSLSVQSTCSMTADLLNVFLSKFLTAAIFMIFLSRSGADGESSKMTFKNKFGSEKFI